MQFAKQFLALNGDTSLLQTHIQTLSSLVSGSDRTQETHAKGEADNIEPRDDRL